MLAHARSRPSPERDILSQILGGLLLHPLVAPHRRINVMAGRLCGKDGKPLSRFMRSCKERARRSGRVLGDRKVIAIEVKRPSTRNNLTDEQRAYLDQVKRAGGICGVATSVEEAFAIVEGGRNGQGKKHQTGIFPERGSVELSVEARLLFIGLWTIADREGRLEDRPKQIKMEIYPADSFDINSLLSELASTDMLLRYEVGGKRYLQIVNFTRHQNPHKDERQSTIPPPDGLSDPSGPADHDEHHASTVQTPCEHHASTVQNVLIPDSLIPDSRILNPESTPAQPASTEVDARPEKPAAGAAVRFGRCRILVEQGADPQTAADYLTLRKAKKAASTPRRCARRCRGREGGDAGSGCADDMLRTGMGWIQGRVGREPNWGRATADDPRAAQSNPRRTHRTKPKCSRKPQPRDITAEVIRIA